MSLEGRAGLITGSGQGIGKGCALELARKGMDIFINDLPSNAENAQKTVDEIESLGREVSQLLVDISSRKNVERLLREAFSRFPHLDLLVNNAMVNVRRSFLEMSVSDFEKVLNVGLWGTFHCSQIFTKEIINKKKEGIIIIIGSAHSHIPYANNLAYNTVKSALNQMAFTMAKELVKHMIRVNVVEPGWTDTPIERDRMSEEELKKAGERLPLGRLGTIKDVGKAVVFLASDDASYITGSILKVDGGWWFPGPHQPTD